MESIIKSGKTVDEAVAAALLELNATEDMVEIEVIDEGNKGLFGIIGGKESKVKVTLKKIDPCKSAENFLKKVIGAMNINADLDIKDEENEISINILGEDMGILIGRRGETLNSLQYLTSLVVNKGSEEFIRVNLDTENYRKKREETLVKLAERLARNAVKYKRNVTLEPMSPYERRIIHASLQDKADVTTFSTGEGQNRRVVIAYKGNKR